MLATWKCHKLVQAGRIIQVLPPDADNINNTVRVTEVLIQLADPERSSWVDVSKVHAFSAEKKPTIGDYLVEYEGGYISWSPKKAFEEGYTKL